MIRTHDEDRNSNLQRYELRWAAQKAAMCLVAIVTTLSYAALLAIAASPNEALFPSRIVGIPLVFIVVAGTAFIVSRPWSFISYMDRIIVTTERRDATLAKRHFLRRQDEEAFQKLEAETRRRMELFEGKRII